jgi:hypothetical protein
LLALGVAFAGASGAGSGIAQGPVTLNAPVAHTATLGLETPPSSGLPRFIIPPDDPCVAYATCVYLSFEVDGDGTGTVAYAPAGIDCRIVDGVEDSASSCAGYLRSHTETSIEYFIDANPAPGNLLTCGGAPPRNAHCSQGGTASGTCEAPCNAYRGHFYFESEKFTLSVSKGGFGSGTVSSQPAGIDCGATCNQPNIPYGSLVTLIATPDKGAVFQAWTGACSGQGASCSLTVTQDTSTTAVFGRASSPPSPPPPPPPGQPPSPPPGQPPPPPPPPPPTRSLLAGRIVYAIAIRQRNRRLLVVRLRVSEPAKAQVRLLQHRLERLQHHFSAKPGANSLSTTIPASLARGTYQLELTLRDTASETKIYRATVVVPA